MTPQFDYQPTLTGEHVIIRPIRAADWTGLYAAAADPKIWEQHPATDRYTQPVFRQYFDGAIASGSAFAFVDRDSGRLFGSSRYYGHDPEKSEVEIGWTFIARDHWGGDYNREIKTLMLNHAFRFVETVVFWVGEANVRSRRAMEKIGGTLREGTFTRELAGATPHVIYEICREQP